MSLDPFTCCFLKIQAPTHNLTLLKSFPFYWMQNPHVQSARKVEELELPKQKNYEKLEKLEAFCYSTTLLKLEYHTIDIKSTSIYNSFLVFTLFTVRL